MKKMYIQSEFYFCSKMYRYLMLWKFELTLDMQHWIGASNSDKQDLRRKHSKKSLLGTYFLRFMGLGNSRIKFPQKQEISISHYFEIEKNFSLSNCFFRRKDTNVVPKIIQMFMIFTVLVLFQNMSLELPYIILCPKSYIIWMH